MISLWFKTNTRLGFYRKLLLKLLRVDGRGTKKLFFATTFFISKLLKLLEF